MRPEGSASVIRAIIQKKQEHEKHKLWYQGPMFRYERPQKGRFRQFHQAGVEYLGYEEGLSEYELISMVIQLNQQLGIKKYKIKINHLGDQDTRTRRRAESRSSDSPGSCRSFPAGAATRRASG